MTASKYVCGETTVFENYKKKTTFPSISCGVLIAQTRLRRRLTRVCVRIAYIFIRLCYVHCTNGRGAGRFAQNNLLATYRKTRTCKYRISQTVDAHFIFLIVLHVLTSPPHFPDTWQCVIKAAYANLPTETIIITTAVHIIYYTPYLHREQGGVDAEKNERFTPLRKQITGSRSFRFVFDYTIKHCTNETQF